MDDAFRDFFSLWYNFIKEILDSMEDNTRLKKLIGRLLAILIIVVAVFFVAKLFSSSKSNISESEYLISGIVVSVDSKNKSFVVDRGYLSDGEKEMVTIKTKLTTKVRVFHTYNDTEFDKFGLDTPSSKEERAKFKDVRENMEVSVLVTEKTMETDKGEFVAKKIRMVDYIEDIPPEILDVQVEMLEKERRKEQEKIDKESPYPAQL